MTTGFFRKKIIRPLASLRLAVFIIVLMGILIAWGTIVEAQYDATAAKKLVYNTWWMDAVFILLVINLIAVMIDRWPWQVRHIGFVNAHIGIIILLLGGWVTKMFGIDGSMRIGIGESNRFVTIPNTDLAVFASFDGDRFTKLFEEEVDFFVNSPADRPLHVPTPEGDIHIVDYMKYALGSERFIESQRLSAGAAVRFQISNENVNLNQWLLQRKKSEGEIYDMGPAQVILGGEKPSSVEKNSIYLNPADQHVELHLFSPGKKTLVTKLKEGESYLTPWMGLRFQILRYLPQAERRFDFKAVEKPTPLTTSAIKVRFQDQEEWVQMNDLLRFFTEQGVFIVRYATRLIDIGEDIHLKKFEVGRYQGTMRAMAYESLVSVPNIGDVLIYMNEPLKHRGFTFYQASFTEDESGRPTASVLSVNYDPGRWLKYLGSLIMVFGIIHLFWFKHQSRKKTKAGL